MLFGFALPWNCSWHYRHPRQLLQQNSERFDILLLADLPGCHVLGVVVSFWYWLTSQVVMYWVSLFQLTAQVVMYWVSLFQLQRLGHLLRVGGSSTTEMHGRVMQLVARAAIRVFCCTWNYWSQLSFDLWLSLLTCTVWWCHVQAPELKYR